MGCLRMREGCDSELLVLQLHSSGFLNETCRSTHHHFKWTQDRLNLALTMQQRPSNGLKQLKVESPPGVVKGAAFFSWILTHLAHSGVSGGCRFALGGQKSRVEVLAVSTGA